MGRAGERDAVLPSIPEGNPSWGVTAQGVTTCSVPELQGYQRELDTQQSSAEAKAGALWVFAALGSQTSSGPDL